jgi:hypothetical protein
MRIHTNLPKSKELNWDILGLQAQGRLEQMPSEEELANWWANLLGTEPERSSTVKRRKYLELSGGSYAVHAHNNSVHWIYSNIFPGEELEEQASSAELSIGTMQDEVVSQFNSRMDSWFNTLTNLKSISTGVFAAYHLENPEDAFKLLTMILPQMNLNSKNCKEVSFEAEREWNSEQFVVTRGAKWTAGRANPGKIRKASFISMGDVAGCILQIRTSARFIHKPTSDTVTEALKVMNKLSLETLKTGDVCE